MRNNSLAWLLALSITIAAFRFKEPTAERLSHRTELS